MLYEFITKEAMDEFFLSIDEEITEEYMILREDQVEYIMENAESNQES